MKKLTALTLTALMCTLLLCACGQNTETATGDEAVASNTVQPVTEKVLKEVETPYAKLKLPSYLTDNVKTEVTNNNPYTLKFSAKDGTGLFTLVFGGKGENLLGTLINGNTHTVIYANIEKLDSKSEKFEEYSEYQECMSSIIENLKKDYEFVVNEIVEEESSATFDIKTDVCTFKYPKKWQDKVNTSVSKDAVRFTCGSVKLFDIYFSKQDNGIFIGNYDGVPLYLVSYKLDKNSQSEEELQQLRAMQDDVNVIIDRLKTEEKFSK